MPRPLSQLFHTRIQDEPVRTQTPSVITLHKHHQHGKELAAYARAASPNGRFLGLESYEGIFIGREIVGYTWFLGPLTTPVPVFFGDALAEIERFLWDERERQGARKVTLPFLLARLMWMRHINLEFLHKDRVSRNLNDGIQTLDTDPLQALHTCDGTDCHLLTRGEGERTNHR